MRIMIMTNLLVMVKVSKDYIESYGMVKGTIISFWYNIALR